MAGTIQRYPQGLLESLGVKGLPAPNFLGDAVGLELDPLQFYGLHTRSLLIGGNAALIQGSATPTTAIPANTWAVAYWAQAVITKQAAMTSMSLVLRINRGGLPTSNASFALARTEPERFGGTGFVHAIWTAPYPVILPPGSFFEIFLEELVGVANCVSSVQAEVGLFP